MAEKDLEQLKKDAVESGYDLPEEPSGGDELPDCGEIEEVSYDA